LFRAALDSADLFLWLYCTAS